ncbi:hypothetical protein Scep_009369 [Stephania cephalantha]|uniref:Uncharacterized protein n=1 Tax=Stephania cephalantha TaxID=152367 RepID=A0AAP0PCG7_9MAGN
MSVVSGMDCTMKADIGKVLADALRYYYFDISQFNQSVIGDELTTTLKAACSCFDKLDFVYLFRAFLRHDLSIWIDVPLFMIGKEVLDPALSISSSSDVKSSYCMTEIVMDGDDAAVIDVEIDRYGSCLVSIGEVDEVELGCGIAYVGVVTVEGITYVLDVHASLFVEGITVVQDSIFGGHRQGRDADMLQLEVLKEELEVEMELDLLGLFLLLMSHRAFAEGLPGDADTYSSSYAGSHSNPRSVARGPRPVVSHGAGSNGQNWDFIRVSASERCFN